MIEVIIFAALLSSWLGSTKVRRIREQRRVRARLRLLPELTSGLAEGTPVRITGTVGILDEALEAPLTGARCVLYRVRVGSGPLSVSHARVAKRTIPGLGPAEVFEIRPFLVDRGADGIVVVDGELAELDLPPSKTWDYQLARREQFRLMHSLRADQATRLEEVILAPGTRVTVIGYAMLDVAAAPPTGEVGFRDTAPLRLRLAGTRARPLTISRA